MSDGPSRLLVVNGRALLPGGDPHQGERCDILIENGTITRIGTGLASQLAAAGQTTETLDATDRLIIPGFVNAHYHSHDTLAKGTMDETPLETWRLLALPPQYPKRSRAEIRARTLIGALECLRAFNLQFLPVKHWS